MSIALALFLFSLGLGMTLWRGPGFALAVVLMPVMMFLSRAIGLQLPSFPDATPIVSVLYGILVGSVAQGRFLPAIRWNALDAVMILLILEVSASAFMNGKVYTGVSRLSEQILWVAPYFLARRAFTSIQNRRMMLWTTAIGLMVLGLFAVVEARFRPNLYDNVMAAFGLISEYGYGAGYRFGLYRARVSFDHPISLGNCAVLLTAIVAVLGQTTGLWRHPTVRAAVAAGIVTAIVSLSFTPYAGLVSGILAYLVFSRLRSGSTLILPSIVVMLALLGVMLATSFSVDTSIEARNATGIFGRSYNVRALIIQRTWPFVMSAGPLGYGETLPVAELELESVDNTYLLWTMDRGWLWLALWLAIPVALGSQVRKALRMGASASQRYPLAAGFAFCLGTMVSMFTVWGGQIYTTFWLVLLGLTSSAAEMVIARAAGAKAAADGVARVRILGDVAPPPGAVRVRPTRVFSGS